MSWRSRRANSVGLAMMVAAGGVALPSPAHGQVAPDSVSYTLTPVVVTATRTPRRLAWVPQPISVVTRDYVQRKVPNTVSDLLRTIPGVDVAGVGANQGRPQIRGMKGQRILLLADGLRLNNARRQSDFGELPALVDVERVERVEVLRGPSSVLYGSDAIGGVVNIITAAPTREGVHGNASFRYGGVEEQYAGDVRSAARFGSWSFAAGASWRTADAYVAPAGSFGSISLAEDTPVDGSGVSDRGVDVRVGRDFDDHEVFASFEGYRAEDAGFGSVAPSAYDPGGTPIAITYPDQDFAKVVAGYRGRFEGGVADEVDVRVYGQDNERELRFGVGPFPIGPTATLEVDNVNRTDIRSWGWRVEARKAFSSHLLLTYGVDGFRDRALGSDTNTTTTTGFGPAPIVDVSTRPQLPEATYLNAGFFVQSEIEAFERWSLVAGARYQSVGAETFATQGLEDQDPVSVTDGTLVASLNSIVRVTPSLSVIGAIGRGFRSPNLIERFFDGPTPEGGGYQLRNTELRPETSLNVDLGARLRGRKGGVDLFLFRNRVRDGIRIAPSSQMVGGLPAFENVNVAELLIRGVEVTADVDLTSSVSVVAGATWLDSEDVDDVENPVGDAYSSRQTVEVRYDDPAGRFWLSGDVRRNGEQADVRIAPNNPIGDVLPSFTTGNVRAGVTVWANEAGVEQRLVVALTNITNALYAEFGNAAFFRPEPKRNLTLAWQVSF